MSVTGFGVHTAMWAMEWNREAAEFAIPEAVKHDIDFLEITMLDPEGVDTAHTRRLGGVVARRGQTSYLPTTPRGPWLFSLWPSTSRPRSAPRP